MAKALGGIATGLTIAALIRTSFEGYDILQTSLSQDVDYAKLQLRLKIEKCRLYNWAESMGLIDIAAVNEESTEDGIRFPYAVQSILEDLFRLFQRAENVKNKYARGYVAVDSLSACCDQHNSLDNSTTTYARATVQPLDPSQTTRIKQTVTWLLYDRKHFTLLVAEIKDLIDKLKDITTPPAMLDGTDSKARQDIGKISDTEALALVSGICAMDHPDIMRLRQQRSTTYTSTHSESSTSQAISDVTVWPEKKASRYGTPKL